MAKQISKSDLMDYIRQAIADEQDKIGAGGSGRYQNNAQLQKELSDMRQKVRLEMQSLDEKLAKLRYTKQELDELILKASKAVRRLEQLKQIRY